ncbi:unnamed protein product [Miscanthus lutarioriparius]|uniref:Uncharacterized protein n=1 Tax=Miscanthus lutarioriparius TaxID=422564 RepID=A0A811RYZ2_9POAL|nr:unnamed protein product [Miscanthus lutarioriparius]
MAYLECRRGSCWEPLAAVVLSEPQRVRVSAESDGGGGGGGREEGSPPQEEEEATERRAPFLGVRVLVWCPRQRRRWGRSAAAAMEASGAW